MVTISDLEQRITAAFDRMDRGLDTLTRAQGQGALRGAQDDAEGAQDDIAPNGAPRAKDEAVAIQGEAPAHLALLMQALQQAKAANVAWAERYSALEAEYSAQTLAMAAEIARLGQGAAPEMGDLPMASRDAEIDELTARIAQQEAELETLRAQAMADSRDIADLVTALAPLVTQSKVPHV